MRLFFNLRHQGRNVWAIPATAALAVVVLALVLRPDDDAAGKAAEPVSFAEIAAIVEERCAGCHSMTPQDVPSAPAGITFDTPEEIVGNADAIATMAVDTMTMPPGNVTGMTDEERRLLGAWIEQGAEVSPP